jgi:protein involved in polysaccharide export with SLBB domain
MVRDAFARVLRMALFATLCCTVISFGQRALAQAPDASTHRIAAGDMLKVTLFDGVNPVSLATQVDNTGSIRLPLLDAVNVLGMYNFEAANKLTELYKTYYLAPVVTLEVEQYGMFKVYLFGSDIPGQLVDVPNGTRLLDLFQLLAQETSSGQLVLARGRYRRIHLLRGGFSLTALLTPPAQTASAPQAPAPNLLQAQAPEAVTRSSGSFAAFANWRPWIEERKRDPNTKVWVIDPLQLTAEGDLSSFNLPVQDGDVIFVPSPERFVDIEGVMIAGRYELVGSETLGDVMRLAGSPNYDMDLKNAVIKRYDAHGRLSRLIFNFYPALDDIEAARSFKLENRDKISFVARENRIFVLGEVHTGGAFDFQEDSTVLDYIALAEGETEKANLAWIAIIRQNRDRLEPFMAADVIQVNFKEIHKGLPNCTDMSLLPGDVVYVPPKGFQFEFNSIIQTVSTAVAGFKLTTNTSSNNTTNNGGSTTTP